ncbi:estrogen receptor isoform X4 [Phyllopteryx taeniolatus]|uniref:estrogen receptor isoform X4 n=1 Tax=Phyllopteryx taeniolatus TaxID=161469 RepID=UPI002AD4377D|nr:estrogen receptor isoform X4 [Phyllopteryx taeniolatus]
MGERAPLVPAPPPPLPAKGRASLNHVAYQCCCAVMLLRQSPAKSRKPCGSPPTPGISPAAPELENLSPSPPPRAPLSGMYPEESRGSGGVATVDFLEGTYDYASPTPAQTPLYSHPVPGYYAAPLDTHGSPSDGSLQSLGSGPTSPLVFVPTSPRLSPFMHPPGHHYLEATSTPIYSKKTGCPFDWMHLCHKHLKKPRTCGRSSETVSQQQASRDDQCGTSDEAYVLGGSEAAAAAAIGVFEMAKETRFCAVCSDYASGYHYGVWSCEGCKAFFKRSIQGHNDYVCPATNQCTIDRNRRKSCQACRLRKCYEVGMMKGGVRKDRGRVIRRDKRRTGATEKLTKETDHRKMAPQEARKQSGGGIAGGGRSSVTDIPPDQVLLLLQGAEPPILCSRQKLSRPYTEVTIMTLLTSMADKELVHMITWAKKLPGAAAGELVAGGADDRPRLEVRPLSRQAHLRSGPHSGQVKEERCTGLLLGHVLFASPSHSHTHTSRVTHQHCRFSISHLCGHCAIPTRLVIQCRTVKD